MKNEPVLTAGVVVGALMSFVVMAVSLGWLRLDETQMGTIEKFLVAAVPLVIALGGAWWARKRVTPIANPKTESGEPAAIIPMSMISPEFLAQVPLPKKAGGRDA